MKQMWGGRNISINWTCRPDDGRMIETMHVAGVGLLDVNAWLSLWHTFRTPILLGLLAALLILRTVMHWKRPGYTLSRTFAIDSPDLVAVPDSKLPVVTENWGFKNSEHKKGLNINGRLSEKTANVVARRSSPRRVTGQKQRRKAQTVDSAATNTKDLTVRVLVFYSSLTGTTEMAAKECLDRITSLESSSTGSSKLPDPELLDLSTIDYEEYFTAPPKGAGEDKNAQYFYLILVPSYDIDTLLTTFLSHLDETHNDFRIDAAPLSPLLGYSVFGFGDREGWPTEADGFCSQAREVDKWMAKLTGGKRAFPLGMGDIKSDAKGRLDEWTVGVKGIIDDIINSGGLGEGVEGSGDPLESDEEDQEAEDGHDATNKPKDTIDDVEDIGTTIRDDPLSDFSTIPVDFATIGKNTAQPAPVREMVPVSSPTYAALVKQGYTIVGSHSGVKICRWTKSALRGRGSCYKYSFYGIKSHLCMETTPSLSCSNKCVFCWRHGTNPVGTTWRWKVDPPGEIFEGVKAGHYKKINMLRGVPGVRAERFAEAFRIRHCALSLVGEPIFYPHINEFVELLHAERISSFLVCNAQHPDELAALDRVTQLYVSIDASNRDSLKRIDRPLHRDFWERFQRCLAILHERRFRQRTVFRLTLVKGFNMADEVSGYADLIALALPCFVEIKGATFCGPSTSSSASASLTMQNVPFYTEVRAFVLALSSVLQTRGLDYGIAAEHAHSCCALLASTRFRVNDKWHTRIDYGRFFALLEAGRDFTPEEYMDPDPTPEWALWGNGGFDPADTRVYTKGRNKGRTAAEVDALADNTATPSAAAPAGEI